MENVELLELSILQKCGEIFYDTLTASDVNVSFQCTFCRKTLIELNTFLQHLQSEHCKRPSIPIGTTEEFSLDSDKEEEEEEENESGEDEENEEQEIEKEETEEFLFATEEILVAAEEDINQYAIDKDEDTTYPFQSAETETTNDHISNESVHSKSQVVKRKHREYNCLLCDEAFMRAWELKQHLNTHDDSKVHKCEYCPASYFYKSNLTIHMRSHRPKEKTRKIEKLKERKVCHYCPRTFSTTTHRRRHERIHTGERPYVCEMCGRSFASSSDMSNHRSSQHLHERNFVCDICDKRFNRRSQLRIHKTNVHTAKPCIHVCTICNASFKGINELKTHINIHREKAYKCLECNKLFAHHSGLYIHQKIHKKHREWLTDT
uniref:C2H2-type domain-containing protein n=1 Tax=Glossina brevipalpis TaxID=37001 RepID=A0A1A9WDW3_9MUSC